MSEDIEIRFARDKDIPAIMQFIEEHWKHGHILAHNEELFRYEWVRQGKVNVVLAEECGHIVGMEGFIPYGERQRDIMNTLWKVIPTGRPLLGMEILDFIRQNADARSISSPGINIKTVELYQYLGFETGKMRQWYRLNVEWYKWQIAVVNHGEVPEPQMKGKGLNLCKLSTFNELEKVFDFETYYASEPHPLKERWYVEHRYFQHPIYHYEVYGICDEMQRAETLVIFRVQEMNGSRALRLVDVIGRLDQLYVVTTQIDGLMKHYKAEYVDIYEKGLDADKMLKAGWLQVEGSGNIIPNYFSPFAQIPVDIIYFTSDPDIVLFKADGDQDRPN